MAAELVGYDKALVTELNAGASPKIVPFNHIAEVLP